MPQRARARGSWKSLVTNHSSGAPTTHATIPLPAVYGHVCCLAIGLDRNTCKPKDGPSGNVEIIDRKSRCPDCLKDEKDGEKRAANDRNSPKPKESDDVLVAMAKFEWISKWREQVEKARLQGLLHDPLT
ncbi:hypothetical protein RUND412_004298 [Rhizina undulata]